jgi:putative toxin-antitoxin system antitoxin component (TIGR02293 family)
LIYNKLLNDSLEIEMTATSAITRKLPEEFSQWKTKLAKANPGARIKIVRAGVSPLVLVSASEHFGMPRNLFAKLLGISPATAERKIKAGSLLGQTETERLERIALIENEADKVFGASDKALDWLTKNNAALGVTPLSMLDTETGAGEVRKVLSAIAYGGAV